MPIVWRFLLIDYLKVLCLATGLFVMLLLTMRLEEIAQFAVLGASSHYLLTFAWYQLGFMIPIALPISALISSLVLMRRLSESGELMALRALGFSIMDIATPLLLAAGFLALINFFLLSEVATQAEAMKHGLKKELQTLNPLIVLQNEKLSQLKGIYTKTFGKVEGSDDVHDLLLCVHHKSSHCLILLIAKELKAVGSTLVGRDVTIWSPFGEKSSRLMVENSARLELPRPNLPELFHKHTVKIEHEHAPFSELVGSLLNPKQADDEREAFKQDVKIRGRKLPVSCIVSELVRRGALGVSILSFTFLGIVYGLCVQRVASFKPLLVVLMLTTLYVCSVLLARKISHHAVLALLGYIVPQMLMVLCSVRTFRRIEKGL